MVIVDEAIALCGLSLLVYRLWPRLMSEAATQQKQEAQARGSSGDSQPKVSIIVPARNEERVLPRLLASLQHLSYKNYEVIVVDDCSDDQTAAIAAAAGVTLVRGAARPVGWNGKQWACWQGAELATGEWLLFTDADTWHAEDALDRIIAFVKQGRYEVASALPYHDGQGIWERLLGPFHLMLLAVTAPYAAATPKRKFAIGQYLLFSRSAYRTIDGHRGVRDSLVEDLPLARRVLTQGLRYGLYTGKPLFGVRMYASLPEFVQGWRRNFRAGFDDSPWSAPLEVAMMIAALTGGWHALEAWLPAVIAVMTISFMLWRQRALGRFSVLGPIFFPFAVLIFCWITLLALVDRIGRRPQKWKGREFHLPSGAS